MPSGVKTDARSLYYSEGDETVLDLLLKKPAAR